MKLAIIFAFFNASIIIICTTIRCGSAGKATTIAQKSGGSMKHFVSRIRNKNNGGDHGKRNKPRIVAAAAADVVHDGNNHSNKEKVNLLHKKDKEDLGKTKEEKKEEESLEMYCQRLCGAGKKKNGGAGANAKSPISGRQRKVKSKNSHRSKRMTGYCPDPDCERYYSDEDDEWCAECGERLVDDLCSIADEDNVNIRDCDHCVTEGGCTRLNRLFQNARLTKYCAWHENRDECETDYDTCMASGVDFFEMDCSECTSPTGCTRLIEYRQNYATAQCEWERGQCRDDDAVVPDVGSTDSDK